MESRYAPEYSECPAEPSRGGTAWGAPGTGACAPASYPLHCRRGRAARWLIIAILAVALVGGGLIAVVGITTLSSPALRSGPAGAADGNVLNSVLGTAGSPAAAGLTGSAQLLAADRHSGQTRRCAGLTGRLRQAGHLRAARAIGRSCLRHALLLRLLGAGHGQFTVRINGGERTIAFERGVVTSVTANQVVIRAADGTRWTWATDGRTTVRQAGHRLPARSLATGQRVLAVGPLPVTVRHARLVLIARPAVPRIS
jgi:hypothetical protein